MNPGRPREVAALDLMRLFAAQAVVLYHLVFLSWAEEERSRGIRAVVGDPVVHAGAVGWASPGWVGVQVFFVISGFVILMSAENKSAADFLIGRVSRIVPGLWAFSLLSAAVLLVTGVLGPAELTGRLLRSLVLFPVGPWVDGAVWTLVAEAVFYFAVYVLIRTGAIGRITAVLLVMTVFNVMLWGAVLAGEAGLMGQPGQWLASAASSYKLRVSLVSTNCYFVVGASLFQLFRQRRPHLHAIIFAANLGAGLIATFYAARSSIGVARFGQTALAAPAVWGVAAIAMALCVLLRLGSGARIGRIAAVAGLLTYPLYLCNQIVGGYLLGLAYRAGLPPAVAVIATVLACTALAGLFALLIERRLQTALAAFLRRLGRPPPILREA